MQQNSNKLPTKVGTLNIPLENCCYFPTKQQPTYKLIFKVNIMLEIRRKNNSGN